VSINLRKLAAIDIVFLGPKVILVEFAAGVLLSMALGIFVLVRGRTFWQIVLGSYLISLGINYVPMFFYAVAINKRQTAHVEIADELADKHQAMSKYRRQSLVLLIPLLPPALAWIAHRHRLAQK
jgi:hypothetical protein